MFRWILLTVAGLALAFSVSAREHAGSPEPPLTENNSLPLTGHMAGVFHDLADPDSASAWAASDAAYETLVQQALRDKVEIEAKDIRQKMPDSLANQLVESKGNETIQIRAESFSNNQAIPFRHSAYGENISPQLSWSSAPENARSFVLIMEDPDALQPQPFVHWIAYNIPAEATGLREGLPKEQELDEPKLVQGRNSAGSTGYFGPRPPDEKTHRYHFQVFALDRMLDLLPGANRQDVVEAMKGHVLAMGEIVGTFEKPQSE
jgi:Raf kinase inhibitor-like YbhB/YbcL family protein